MKGAKVNYNMHVNACPTNEYVVTIEGMRVWIRKARNFRANNDDSKQQDITNFGLSG